MPEQKAIKDLVGGSLVTEIELRQQRQEICKAVRDKVYDLWSVTTKEFDKLSEILDSLQDVNFAPIPKVNSSLDAVRNDFASIHNHLGGLTELLDQFVPSDGDE